MSAGSGYDQSVARVLVLPYGKACGIDGDIWAEIDYLDPNFWQSDVEPVRERHAEDQLA